MVSFPPLPPGPSTRYGQVPYGGRVDSLHHTAFFFPSCDGIPRLFDERRLLFGCSAIIRYRPEFSDRKPKFMRYSQSHSSATCNAEPVVYASGYIILEFQLPRLKPLSLGGVSKSFSIIRSCSGVRFRGLPGLFLSCLCSKPLHFSRNNHR